MKVGNKEIKLFYSNLAAREISELCGGMKNFGVLLKDAEGNQLDKAVQLSNIAKIIRILANAEIARANKEIDLGISDGVKQEKFNDEDLEVILDATKVDDYLMEVFSCMRGDSKFVVPDGLKITEADEDLEEIEAEKNP